MIDWTKPVQTRDGRKARVICTDRKAKEHSIVALIMQSCGREDAYVYSTEGRFTDVDLGMDLINVPQRHKHADVIIAWANGAEIECRYPPGTSRVKSCWYSFGKGETPSWANDLEYRVKPE